MRISINARERADALLALGLVDKECEATRKALERLRLEPMAVMALQGACNAMRTQLKDEKRHVYDWTFDLRRALAAGLHLYQAKLEQLAAKEESLFVPTPETSSRIGDMKDFYRRLVDGQETFFREAEVETPAAVAAPVHETPAHPLPPALAKLANEDAEHGRPSTEWLSKVASALERGENRLTQAAFTTLAEAVLMRAARVVPEFNGTYAGGHLMQELIHDDQNAIVLASWIRNQVLDAPPPKLTDEAVQEIRSSIEPEIAKSAPNPLEVACPHCGAKAGKPCKSVGGKIVASSPHIPRLDASGADGTVERFRSIEAYAEAVIRQVFGRVDDELRVAVQKRRSIDLAARWVVDMKAGAAHATP